MKTPSKAASLILGIAIVAATTLSVACAMALPGDLVAYALGDRSAHPEGVGATTALAHLGMVVGFGFGLFALATITARMAISGFGGTLGRFMRAAAVLAIAAGVVESLLLLLSGHGENDWLVTATAAAAIVKWCALLPATFSVATTLTVLWRLVASRQFRRGTRQAQASLEWWDRVLTPADQLPDPVTKSTAQDQTSDVDGYSVPGSQDLLKTSVAQGRPLTAICLSGGGIRSACVAMGALQTFSKEQLSSGAPAGLPRRGTLVDDVDYIISVSGGGYTAGARLLAVQKEFDDASEEAPAVQADESLLISDRYGEGSVEFDHLRRHSSYIADRPSEMVGALAEVLKNLVASTVSLFVWAVALGLVAGLGLAAIPVPAFMPLPDGAIESIADEQLRRGLTDYATSLARHDGAAWWAIATLVIAAAVFAGVSLWYEVVRADTAGEARRKRWGDAAQGAALLAVVVAVVTVALPGLMWASAPLTKSAADHQPAAAFGGAVGVVLLQFVAALAAMGKGGPAGGTGRLAAIRKLLPPGVFRILLVLVTLAVLVIAWFLTLGGIAVRAFIDKLEPDTNALPGDALWWLAVSMVVIVFVGFSDVTSLSLHPFYRRQLARAFDVRRVLRGAKPYAEAYPDSEATWLDRYGHAPRDRPRFVFACAAAVSGGKGTPAPGYKAVSLTLSAEHVGGPELGWLNTPALRRLSPPRLRRDLTVQAAVAVSGAAFASAMGRMSTGYQTLLAASGARLGTWLPNPAFVSKTKTAVQQGNWAWPAALPRVRGSSYFFRELLGINHKEARLVQVTDGGHYENMGLVEALRRRCQLIVCIDGGGDTPPLLSGLALAMRLARSELGIEIELDSGDGPFSVDNLTPGSGVPFDESSAFASLNARLTRGTVVRGRICYPDSAGLYARRADGTGLDDDRSMGTLIVAKAVLWQSCPYWLLTYAAEQPIFPHDKTSDQWFSDDQFVAYTELGRLIGREAVVAWRQPLYSSAP